MATNEGAWPINAATPVGMFRFQVGDVVGTPHDPGDGKADFEFMSDDTITALIAANPFIDTAKASALQSMAAQLITSAQDIQVDDIRLKTVERAGLFLQLAQGFGAAANASAAADAFEVVPMVAASNFTTRWPQGQPRPTGASGF